MKNDKRKIEHEIKNQLKNKIKYTYVDHTKINKA